MLMLCREIALATFSHWTVVAWMQGGWRWFVAGSVVIVAGVLSGWGAVRKLFTSRNPSEPARDTPVFDFKSEGGLDVSIRIDGGRISTVVTKAGEARSASNADSPSEPQPSEQHPVDVRDLHPRQTNGTEKQNHG
jgi:hypothetical protein